MSVIASGNDSMGAGPSSSPRWDSAQRSNRHAILREQSVKLLQALDRDQALSSISPSLRETTIETIRQAADKVNPADELSPHDVLEALSNLASFEEALDTVIHNFRPLLLDIFARWIGSSTTSAHDSECRLVCLSAVASLLPDLWSVIHAFIQSSPYRDSPLGEFTLEELPQLDAGRLQALLLSYWRLLHADPHIAIRNDWSTLPIHKLATEHSDLGVRYLAIQTLACLLHWGEKRRSEAERQWCGDPSNGDIFIEFGGREADGSKRNVNAWILPLLEARRVEDGRQRVDEDDPFTKLSNDDWSHISPFLSPRTVLVAHTLFFRDPPEPGLIEPFTHVPTSAFNTAAEEIVPHLRSGSPILISGPSSSGKTHLIRHLNHQLHPTQLHSHHVVTISLADTTIDVKAMIGTYVSSPTRPGSFEWMEGALTRAVRAGKWVVFDDIDRASMEMLVTIAGLARTLQVTYPGRRAKLPIPGRGSVEAGEGFALFATRTLHQSDPQPPNFFGSHNFNEVTVRSPSEVDVLRIMSVKYPKVPESVATTLVSIWRAVREELSTRKKSKGRDVGLRDLDKWCARVAGSLPSDPSIQALESAGGSLFANPAFQDEVLLEACDIFIGSLDSTPASNTVRETILQLIAEFIRMDLERALSLVFSRRPRLEISAHQVDIGRILLPRTHTRGRPTPRDDRPFALTGPSLALLERIAAATTHAEPLVLVGETGTGKTTAVQYIANACGRPLTTLNLSTQTESSDLFGGFKPIAASISARSLQSKWQRLFCDTFSMAKVQNGAYVEAATKALSARRWERLAELWKSSARRAIEKLERPDDSSVEVPNGRQHPPTKRRRGNIRVIKTAQLWRSLLSEINDFDLYHVKGNSKLVFQFVEGPLVTALKNGEWILLDEINLATQETLEAVTTLLEGPTASLILTERGDLEPVTRHPDFRLFACMNPATDVGKKDLPPSLRGRFTEIYVPPPDEDREALTSIVSGYIGEIASSDRAVILDVVELYLAMKRLSTEREIVDGSNAAPHFSMRTLARALMFAGETSVQFGLRRAIWEGFLMAFTMSLDAVSAVRAHELCQKFLLSPMKNARAALSQLPSLPLGVQADDYIRFGSYWLKRGSLPSDTQSRYVITPSVQAKLSDLARVILTGRYPVLIQGPTSSGKTSAVEFLARQTGHRFVRINNHEHTDIQEYLGTYVTDAQSGQLVFQDGLLVTAVRQGHWIVLDELNLAPTDVLEALNRLLDDNRELVIPETQEILKPHPHFILFATQNPPGLYAGRKILSRAFRNRFLEVHFDDVPKEELETILCQRCQIAPSYAAKIVQVFLELQHRRQASRVFESKQSFATLRDLFRWADRGAVGYEQLAEDGYMLLAERTRLQDDKMVIKEIIEEVMKVKIDERKMYDLSTLERLPFDRLPDSTMVWTRAMQRLFRLVASALANKEPVLLVGETGSGKTSVCEVIATAFNQSMIGVNCHQNMETADLIGSQRPVRNRNERKAKVISRLSQVVDVPASATPEDLVTNCESLIGRVDLDQEIVKSCLDEARSLSSLFEWSDGPLVQAMISGDLLLLDEVSLADDSVLERLNSVLEPGRTLVLAEKGTKDIDAATYVAQDNFHVVATMNPGGDFGKKELSPALRNRFTEIWVPPLDDRDDLLQIIGHSWRNEMLGGWGKGILDFTDWFKRRIGDSVGIGLRDILSWISFMDVSCASGMGVEMAFHHGGQMAFIDGLESLPQVAGLASSSVTSLRAECLEQLSRSIVGFEAIDQTHLVIDLDFTAAQFKIGGFSVAKGLSNPTGSRFHFDSPTTKLNAMRVCRACQLPKAVLLEGSPGVGKTSLISALADVTGHTLLRINLSDQTDLIDLFGSDLPVEGGGPGEFRWREAAFLMAMQNGHWVLLDEMNLASQTVLEGLNAVLDHRGTVFIPELGRAFERHPDFRVFAAQNPLQQGGGRKGLPKSFLNRFTKVYLQEHTPEDLQIISQALYPGQDQVVRQMITFNEEVRKQTTVFRSIGQEGSPWEFNLRDLLRWFHLLSHRNGLETSLDPIEFFQLVYLHRFRNSMDRQAVSSLFERVFSVSPGRPRATPFITSEWLQIGHSLLKRNATSHTEAVTLQPQQLELAESVVKVIEQGWLIVLPGPSGTGGRDLVRHLASVSGRSLGEFAMHPGVDASEILGSFEQQDYVRLTNEVFEALRHVIIRAGSERADFDPVPHLEQLKSHRKLLLAGNSPDIRHQLAEFANGLIEQSPDLLLGSSARASIQEWLTTDPDARGFHWVDGDLVTSLRSGGWFLISEANLCSPSVLDRLNSLCETDGVLVLSEKGSATGAPEVIKPHPSFRLFMTYDPKYGELSRAMRNRGVELYTQAFPSNDSPSELDTATMTRIREMNLDQSDTFGPSMLANSISIQSVSSLPLLRFLASTPTFQNAISFLSYSQVQQFLTTTPEVIAGAQGLAVSFCADLPIDASLNPNIGQQPTAGLFRLIQASLRAAQLRDRLQQSVADPRLSKTVLVQSERSSNSATTRKNSPGKHIAPLIQTVLTSFNEALAASLAPETGVPVELLADFDSMLVLISLVFQHALKETFDYSVMQLLAEWLTLVVRRYPTFSSVVPILEQVVRFVEISRGHVQMELWSLFREGTTQPLSSQVKDRVDTLLDHLMRHSLLEALVRVKPEEREGMIDRALIGLDSTQISASGESAIGWPNWPQLAQRELKLVIQQRSRDDLELLFSEHRLKPSDVLSLSALQLLPVTPGNLLRATVSWLQRIDQHQTTQVSLFAPNSMEAVLHVSEIGATTLADWEAYEFGMKMTTDLVLASAYDTSSMRHDCSSLAFQILGKILSAFGVHLGSDMDMSFFSSLDQLETSSSYVRAALSKHILPLFSDLSASPFSLDTLGYLWLAISRVLVDLYITDVPLDPAVRRVLTEEVCLHHITMLEEETEAVTQGEMRLKGIADSVRLAEVLDRLRVRQEEHRQLGPKVDRPTDPARLAALFDEVQNFLNDTMEETKVGNLIDTLLDGAPQAFQREQSFQLASSSFVQRLQVNYAALDDLAFPIITAILFAKFGLRCIARHVQLQRTSPDPLVQALKSFPSPRQLQGLLSIQTLDPATQLLIIVETSRTMSVTSAREAELETIVSRLDQIYQTWSAVRLREQREAQEAESLYRVKKTDVDMLSDQEQEEKEFNELFPAYVDIGDEVNSATPQPKSASKSSGFGPEEVAAFHQALITAFDQRTPERSETKLFDSVFRQSFDPIALSEEFDRSSLPLQIDMLHRRRRLARETSDSTNFYLSPNEPEIRRAHTILARMTKRLDDLILEWPEQMVMQHIRDRVLRVMQLDIQSPVAMVLTALEGLLLHTDDWEPFANRDNSLAYFRNEISSLIVSWRKLELASWSRLLDDVAKQHLEADAEWSLRLYGALVHGAMASEDRDQHLKETLPLLKKYLDSSSIGRYPSRLDSLRVLQRLLSNLCASPALQTSALRPINVVLSNVIANGELFLPRIEESLGKQRAEIDKTIKDFIKLASWKDVNPLALKASAQKSHRQLHRSMRKFREVLQQPVSPILADINSVCAQTTTQPSLDMSLQMPEVIPFDIDQSRTISINSASVSHLPAVLDKFKSVLYDSLQMPTSISSHLEDLSTKIIETASDLAKATPSTMTKENKKLINNLAARKRKAFSDLLKTLRAMGFTSNLRADLLAQQQSALWLASRPPLDLSKASSEMQGVARRLGDYHQRQMVLMTALRASMQTHSDDIATGDLQRGLGFTESLLARALSERDSLVVQMSRMSRLDVIVDRLRVLASAKKVLRSAEVPGLFVKAELHLRDLSTALNEVQSGIQRFRELQNRSVSAADLGQHQTLMDEIDGIVDQLSRLNEAIRVSEIQLVTDDEMHLATLARDKSHAIAHTLMEMARDAPEFRHLLEPVVQMAKDWVFDDHSAEVTLATASSDGRSDDLIKAILVMAQNLSSQSSATTSESDEDFKVAAEFKSLTELSSALRVEEIIDRLLGEIQASPHALGHVVPFLQVFAHSNARLFSRQLDSVKAMYKLSYVVGRIMLDLAQRGFCKPQEESDAKAGDEEGETVEGTGMGAGTGDKNVSAEITEESQVEGLQGEDEEEHDGGDNDEEGDAVSMEEDFEGDLGEGKERDDQEESEDGEDEGHDEAVGDVDPLDPGAVDEKFWEGEQEQEKDGQDGDREDVVDRKEQEGESEMAAKDEKDAPKQSKAQHEDDSKSNAEQGEEQEEGGDEGEVEHQEDGIDQDDNQTADPPTPEQDQVDVPEGQALDLPEDIDFDDNEDAKSDLGDGIDDLSIPDEGEPMEGDVEDGDASMASSDNGDEIDDGPEATGVGEEEKDQNEEDAEIGRQDLDLSAPVNEQMGQEMEKGGGAGGQTLEESGEGRDEDRTLREEQEQEDGQPQGKGMVAQQEQPGASSDQRDQGSTDASGAPLPATQSAQSQRSLGDIMRDIRRRRDEILAQQEHERQVERGQETVQAKGQVEYLKEGDEGEDQALGPAGEEERKRLGEMNIVDEEDQQDGLEANMQGMEDDEDDGDQEEDGLRASAETKAAKGDEDLEMDGEEGRSKDKALTRTDVGVRPANNVDAVDLSMEEEGPQDEEGKRDEEFAEGEAEASDPDPASLAITQDDRGEKTWRYYSGLTRDLSFALCEQLRLILEPTLATRLQGDFRTGKRLNMRKIIPYIASEYTKDKIWLRRTKPSKREYQVLLSLDDSRSMAESHSVHLAYQTLALVCQALTKLEVGQVGVAKFGETVEFLHPFQEMFTDVDGGHVMSSLRFDQQRTDVVSLVDKTLEFLGEAREQASTRGGGTDLWQLEIIISDGVCQDHDKLRVLLRKAMEERVMIVFIIIDSLNTASQAPSHSPSAPSATNNRPSILSMQSVEYKMVNGQMELEMNRYLDTFPFDFFVVLRDVEALPGVLADTLRQWMARVSQSQE